MNAKATDRQLQILEYIVDIFVSTGNPVSSRELLEEYKLKWSSATIRAEMATLEELELIEKPHTSGGRIPTTLGYEVYVNQIKERKTNIGRIKKQIKELFNERDNSIEDVLKNALSFIHKSTSTVILTKNELDSVRLQDIKAYKLDNNNIMIIAVFSNGRVNNVEYPIRNLKFDDIQTAISIFSERLKDTKASELEEKALSLKGIIEEQIKGLEDNFQDFVRSMFNALLASTYEYSDTGSLITSKNIDKEILDKLMKSIKNESIWEMIAKSKKVDAKNTQISVDLKETGLNQISSINKSFNMNGEKKEIALIGPSWQKYKEIIEVLDVVEEEMAKAFMKEEE